MYKGDLQASDQGLHIVCRMAVESVGKNPLLSPGDPTPAEYHTAIISPRLPRTLLARNALGEYARTVGREEQVQIILMHVSSASGPARWTLPLNVRVVDTLPISHIGADILKECGIRLCLRCDLAKERRGKYHMDAKRMTPLCDKQ